MTANRSRAHACVVAGFAVLAVAGSGALSRAADTVPRYIESYTGPDSAYDVERAGQRLAPHPGLTLQVADCVIVREGTNKQPGDNANRMVLMIDGSEVHLDATHAKYCVEKASSPVDAASAAIARMVTSLGALFHRSQDDFYTEHTAVAQTRGGAQEPALIYLLKTDHPRVAEGTRALAVAWIDGKAPFTVALSSQTSSALAGAALTSKDGVTSHSTQLDPVALAPGRYQVRVSDSTGGSAVAEFAVVPASALPAPSAADAAALKDPAQPAALRAAVYAAWLVQQSADWRFEAYQQVAPFAASADLARALSFELSGGA